MNALEIMDSILIKNGIITAFLVVGVIIWFSYFLSKKLTNGKFHGSAIAIIISLILAYFGGYLTGGEKGLADIEIFSGLAILGGAMFRDFAIVATAYGVNTSELKRAGRVGILSLFIGVILSFVIGAVIASLFWLSRPS